MAQTLRLFATNNELSLKNVVTQLNNWCGHPFWDEESTISKSQSIVFSSINWSKSTIEINNLPPSVKGEQLKRIKIPKEYHIVPTSENIVDIIFDWEFFGYPEFPSISSRIKSVISVENPIIQEYSFYDHLLNFSSKDLKSIKFHIINELLKEPENSTKRFDEQTIFELFINYCYENKMLVQKDYLLFKNLIPQLKIPINYELKTSFTNDEFKKYFSKSEYRKSKILFSQFEYFYKIKLDTLFFENFNVFLLNNKISTGRIIDYMFNLIKYIEIIQPINYLTKSTSNDKLYEPTKTRSIYSLSVPMGKK